MATGSKATRRAGPGRPLHVALATAACFAILCLGFSVGNQYPFGVGVLATGETSALMLPLAAGLREYGLGYSLSLGLGMDTTAFALQMLASPFTWLLYLPGITLAQGANLLVLAKLTAAACTAAVLFTGKYAPFSPGLRLGAVLGVWYALGGFALVGAGGAVALLDILWLLPLGTLALGCLARKGQVLPMALVWFAALVAASRQCLVLLPLFAMCTAVWLLFFADAAKGGVLALRLVAAFFPALLLSAPVWLTILAANGYEASPAALFAGLTPFKGTLARLAFAVCGGALPTALAIVLWGGLYRRRRVRFLLVCLGASLLPLVFAPLAEFWGWLSSTGDTALLYLPGFLSFLLLCAALEALYRRPQPKKDSLPTLAMVLLNVGVFVGLSLFILGRYGLAAVLGEGWDAPSLAARYLLFHTVATAAVVFGLCVLRSGIDLTRRAFALALSAVVAVGGVYAALVYLVPVSYADTAAVYLSADTSRVGAPDASAGRVQALPGTNATLPAAAGYAGLGSATGGANADTLAVYKKLGYSGYGVELSGYGGTIVSDAFLNVSGTRQAVVLQSAPAPTLVTPRQPPATNGWATVVYAAPEEIAAVPEGDRFAAQDWLYRQIFGGEGDITRRYAPTRTEGVDYEEYENQLDYYGVWQAEDSVTGLLEYEIEVGEREALYFDCFRFISNALDEVVNDGLAVRVNGVTLAGLYPSRELNGIVYLGTFENQTVTVQIDLLRSELVRSFGVAGILESDVAEAVAALPEATADINGKAMAFTVDNAGEKALLVLPMAYTKDATATVNGADTPVYRVLDGLAAVPLQAGDNSVAVRFAAASGATWVGWLLFVTGILALTVVWRRWRGCVVGGHPTAGQAATGKLCRLALLLAGVLAALVLVCVPLALWASGGLLFPPAGGTG